MVARPERAAVRMVLKVMVCRHRLLEWGRALVCPWTCEAWVSPPGLKRSPLPSVMLSGWWTPPERGTYQGPQSERRVGPSA